MLFVTGTYNKINGAYKMHAPFFPYESKVYIGYTFKQMQRKYRQDYNLKYKRIEWIII